MICVVLLLPVLYDFNYYDDDDGGNEHDVEYVLSLSTYAALREFAERQRSEPFADGVVDARFTRGKAV